MYRIRVEASCRNWDGSPVEGYWGRQTFKTLREAVFVATELAGFYAYVEPSGPRAGQTASVAVITIVEG